MTSDWTKNFRARLEDVGWRVERSGSNQHKVFDAKGKLLLVYSATPSDHRSMLNALSQAKRAGLLILEQDIKLVRERERLARLEASRANGHTERPVPPAVFTSPPPPPPPVIEVEEVKMDQAPKSIGYVDGVAIMAVAPAQIKTPVMPKPGPLADAEELLLADQRVIYRCAKPAATGTQPDLAGVCHKTFDTVHSLQAHMRYHSRKTPSPAPDRRGDTTKKEKAALVSTVETRSTSTGVARLQERVTAIAEALELISRGLKTVKTELTEVQCELAELRVADDETLRKAAEFDKVRSTFSSMFS